MCVNICTNEEIIYIYAVELCSETKFQVFLNQIPTFSLNEDIELDASKRFNLKLV